MMKAVIFDIDGTLVDSVDLHAEAWHEAFAHFGYEIPTADIRTQIGKGGDKLMPTFLTKEQVRDQGEEIEKFRGKLFMTEYMPRVKPFPQVRALFEKIKSLGMKIALASSADKDQLKKLKKVADISDLVDCETSSDDAEASKPDPDIFQAAIKCLKPIDPKEMVVVGDTPYDAEGAAKAGLRTVGVLSGGFDERLLQRAGCCVVYRDASHLMSEFSQFIQMG